MSEMITDEIDLREYVAVVRKHYKLIIKITLGFTILALLVSFVLPSVYEGKTTILIRNSSSSSSSLSQYSGLASLVGVKLPGAAVTSDDLIDVLQSNSVAEKVLDDLDLVHRIKGWDSTNLERQQLVDRVKKMIRKPKKPNGSVMEFIASANDAQLAADLANEYVIALSYYWNILNITEAQAKIKYITEALPSVNTDLKKIEQKMRFTNSNGLSILSGQSTPVQRDYDIYNSVYTMLRKELESSKLEAAKDISPFSVVDKAEKPLKRSSPKIILNTLIGLILGGFAGVFTAFFQEYWEKSGNAAKQA